MSHSPYGLDPSFLRSAPRFPRQVFGVAPRGARKAAKPRRRFKPLPGEKHRYKLSVVSMQVATLGAEVTSAVLPASQGKGITSVKFSPSLRYVLIGFGVRGQRNPNADPAHDPDGVDFSTVACSLYRTLDMRLTAVVRSSDDDVNIAVFNPKVGHGFAYGTKQGRLRVWGTHGRDSEDGKLKPVW